MSTGRVPVAATATMRNRVRHIDERIGNLIVFNWAHHLQKAASQWSDAELAEKMKSIRARGGRKPGCGSHEGPTPKSAPRRVETW